MIWLALLAATSQPPQERPLFTWEGQTCTEAVLDATEAHLDAAGGTEEGRLIVWHVLQARRGLSVCGIVEGGEERSEVMTA